MDLLRKVRKSPQFGKPSSKVSKHSKLGEGWDENREAVTEGVTFYLKYLGSTLLDELPTGQSYGEGQSSKAVQRIVDMAKAEGKKLKKVSLKVTPHGIRVQDMVTKEVCQDMSIYRISFCTADKNHDKVFAFIARNTINETMECYAYFCAKAKIAQAVTLSVSQAFKLATDHWENTQNKIRNKTQQKNKKEDNRLSESTDINTYSSNTKKNDRDSPSHQVDIITDSHPRLPKPDSSKSLEDETSSSPQHRSGWHTFDEESENLDDCFSQLAENRSRNLSIPTFSTNLEQEDLDESVTNYMNAEKCFEAFSRQRSMEDLLNI